MQRALRLLIVVAIAPFVASAQSLADGLREQLKIQQAMIDRDLARSDELRLRLEEAWARVEQQSADLLRAVRLPESLDGLELRDDDLRQAEAELTMQLESMQRVRRSLVSGRALMAATEEEIRRIEGAVGVRDDPLTGTWRLVVEPGGQEGLAYLRLEGTLVQGTYRLSGDWTGSLRGTFVADKVRLERIDSQVGFVAILHGRLEGRGEGARLQGSWEATQLATGMPSAGTWVATRSPETVE